MGLKQIMNNILLRIVYMLWKKYWDILDKTELIGEKLSHGENDYENGGAFCG